jgi:hypothetical protein
MYRWECADWKWGNFRQHCEREYRMGETCGTKLIFATQPLKGDCQLCQNIQKKQRRLQKAQADFNRFKADPTKQATAQVKWQEIIELQQEIKRMMDDLHMRRNNVTNGRRTEYRG